ncbi:MAG TPA: polysaccharide deacetylase family protein [Candidatus Bathyarchaeia archaeon]|nr:polysaccharide deacetylase family protein [Candidatus Bathyarchaeia archaeon]
MKERLKKTRSSLFLWTVFPFFFIWVSGNYLVSFRRETGWRPRNPARPALSSFSENYLVSQPEIKPLSQIESGLVTIWFDDGWLSQYEIAAPILARAGFPAAVSVVTDYTGYGGYLDWLQLRDLQKKGWEITSHGVSHYCDDGQIADSQAELEFYRSRQELINEGFRPGHFVAPCGLISSRTGEFAQKYYRSLRTSDGGFNPLPVEEPYSLKAFGIEESTSLEEIRGWLHEAKNSRSWLIFIFHQVDKEDARYGVAPEKFEGIITEIKSSGLSVVLPSQVLEVGNG